MFCALAPLTNIISFVNGTTMEPGNKDHTMEHITMEHWCHGEWHNGALVPWSIETMEHGAMEQLAHWNIGSLEHWHNGALVPWSIGTLEHWFLGALAQWNIGALEHWHNGALVP